MLTRRNLIRGIGALLAAPAIVRVASLMPVRSLPFSTDDMTVICRENILRPAMAYVPDPDGCLHFREVLTLKGEQFFRGDLMASVGGSEWLTHPAFTNLLRPVESIFAGYLDDPSPTFPDHLKTAVAIVNRG